MTDTIIDTSGDMIRAAHAEWQRRAEERLVDHPLEHVTSLIDAALDAVDKPRVIADAIVARRTWQAVSKLLPIAAERLKLISGSGCEAASQRSYLRGQYDLLTSELWVALGLPVPPEFDTITTSVEGRIETMTEPEEQAVEVETAEAETTGDAAAGADAAADDAADSPE